jgi:hypothetical protein
MFYLPKIVGRRGGSYPHAGDPPQFRAVGSEGKFRGSGPAVSGTALQKGKIRWRCKPELPRPAAGLSPWFNNEETNGEGETAA